MFMLGAVAALVPVAVAQAKSVERRVVVCVDVDSARIRLVGSGSCSQGERRRTWPVSGPAPQLCIDSARRLSVTRKGACVDGNATLIRMREGTRFVACANKVTGEMKRPSRWSRFTCAATSRTVRWVSAPRKAATPTTTTSSTTSTTTLPPAAPSVASFGIGYADDLFALGGSNETLSPTVSNGVAASYSYTGTLPTGVTFDTTTGEFVGPAGWNENFASVAAGFEHSCAVTTTGRALCWGRNLFGNIGDGTTTNRSVPTQVSGMTSGIESIAAGNGTSCAISNAGALKCWGLGDYGQIGDRWNLDRSTPTESFGMSSGVQQVSVSPTGKSVCAVMTGGGAKCWGLNDRGQLGNSSTVQSWGPANVTGLASGVAQVAVGGSYACALTTAGAVKCWGANGVGELGIAPLTGDQSEPKDVVGLSSGVTAIGVGLQHACALLSDGTVKCWGQNSDGRLGDGTTTARATPVAVYNVTGATHLSVGQVHTCVIVDGGVTCWGANGAGQLGDGFIYGGNAAPTAVTGLPSNATSISAGGYHTCAAFAGGEARCWGMNNNGVGLGGQLGDGTVTSSASPVSVSGAGNPGFPAAVTVTATSTTGRTATWSGTLRIETPAG